jgi:acetolactate synthase-1/2/3 large subunit
VAPRGTLTPESLCQALAAVQPPDAIVVDEAATSGLPFTFFGGDPHTILGLTGGSIGQGLPCAVGAAVACPDRRVIAFEADGSGMYTVQALWTMAREGLNVTTLVCANRKYRILQFELMRAGVPEPGRQAARLTELAPPPLDWVSLARGLGVPGVRVDSADALVAELQRALAEPGPSLIEALL